MASIPTWPKTSTTIMCSHMAESAQTLFTTALEEETGLFFRSTGAALIAGDGAINVQVPAANVQQIQAQSSMVLRIEPKNPKWTAWPEGEEKVHYREYDMGLCRFPSLAQRAAGGGGSIIGARQISLRVALKFEQGRCSHTPPQRRTGVWTGPGPGLSRTGDGGLGHSPKEPPDACMVDEASQGGVPPRRRRARRRRRKQTQPNHPSTTAVGSRNRALRSQSSFEQGREAEKLEGCPALAAP
jgi:hypothetical protein